MAETTPMKKILVTGGLGYIGSHTVVALANIYEIEILDNLYNSSLKALDRLNEITGKSFKFFEVDLVDNEKVREIVQNGNYYAVIHFAGFKAVGESVKKPLMYYRNNLVGAINLTEACLDFGCNKFIFSSSACVYGENPKGKFDENDPLQPTNPYGQTKVMIEQVLKDVAKVSEMNVISLRYFNPVGAHPSGKIGEDPKDIPNNLFPYIQKVAVGELPKLSVFGSDYDTHDGTGVRDYIHVQDLAAGHVAALEKIEKYNEYTIFNLGTGNGSSVLDVVKEYSRACGKDLPHTLGDRRPGDVATLLAIPDHAEKGLEWKAQLTLVDMCRDSWKWISNNPRGYES